MSVSCMILCLRMFFIKESAYFGGIRDLKTGGGDECH